jgi:hypothetical protein
LGRPSSGRLTCLSDNTSVEEEVLQNEREKTASRFRYVVWNYATAKARAIAHGVGDFHYTDLGGGGTHITRSYAFKLKEDSFQAILVPLVALFFGSIFLSANTPI